VHGQGGKKPIIGQGHGTTATQHYQVDTTQTVTVPAKALTHNAFYAVAIDGPPRVFSRGCKPQARCSPAIGPGKNPEAGIGRGRCGLCKQIPKIPRSSQTGLMWKACIGRTIPRQLVGQVDRRARPFARRIISTLRPLRVDMRVRKPWVRARFTRLG